MNVSERRKRAQEEIKKKNEPIPVFSAGKIIGFVDGEVVKDISKDKDLTTMKPVTMEVKVMFFADLEYGLLVPIEIAEKIEDTVKKAVEDMDKFSESVNKLSHHPSFEGGRK